MPRSSVTEWIHAQAHMQHEIEMYEINSCMCKIVRFSHYFL